MRHVALALARAALGNLGVRGVPRLIAQSAVQVVHTGNTNEIALATITIPGGTLGANGALVVEPVWSHTASVNNKTLRARLGGLAGTIIYSKVNGATVQSEAPLILLANRNVQNAQIAPYSPAGNYFSGNTAAPATHAIDTSTDKDLVLSGQLANAGEQVRLEYYSVFVVKP